MQKDRNIAKLFHEKAVNGDVMAMNNLDVCYHTGKGVVEDHATAFEWYLKAAELGDTYERQRRETGQAHRTEMDTPCHCTRL